MLSPDNSSVFVACCLTPLDKCPGVRPTGIGEVPRCITAWAMLQTMGKEAVEEAVVPLKMCSSQDCESAIHTMWQYFRMLAMKDVYCLMTPVS